MKNINLKFKIIFIAVFTVLITNYQLPITSAQTSPQFLVSWQAQSYVPAWYEGKIIPSAGSKVSVSFELIDGGKIVNLSQTAVRWYLGDKLVKNENSGLGIKNYSFINNNYGNDSVDVRISLPDYNGNTLDKVISIPLKSPEIDLETKKYDRKLSKGDNLIIGWPFFFNTNDVKNLAFSWSAQGNGVDLSSKNLLFFNVNIGADIQSGTSVMVQSFAQNLKNNIESARKLMQFEVE